MKIPDIHGAELEAEVRIEGGEKVLAIKDPKCSGNIVIALNVIKALVFLKENELKEAEDD